MMLAALCCPPRRCHHVNVADLDLLHPFDLSACKELSAEWERKLG